jgi:hypothetical protein
MSERTRRDSPRRVGESWTAAIAIVLVTACGQGSATGPEAIHWDRQTCEHCQMVISDRVDAAEIRLPGERRVHAFDDLGCALLWLDHQGLLGKSTPGADAAKVSEAAEVWVRDATGSRWIDGRQARYAGGFSTPMAYGYGVAEEGESLDAIRLRIREAERGRRGLE